MSLIVSHAMVLAAGLGQRMRPLTETVPKPLLKVGGKLLIDYSFDKLRAAQVQVAVVNVHYLAAQIIGWANSVPRPAIVISDETGELLDTGGGIAKALGHFGSRPFFVLNSDSFWIDGKIPALERLRLAWNDATMDCLLLLCPVEKTVGYDGKGDFELDAQGLLTRSSGSGALAYIGGYLVHPRIFPQALPARFSMNLLWNRAIAEGRLHGVSHDGSWYHVGTPGAIAMAETKLSGG